LKRVDQKTGSPVDKNMAYTPTGALTNDGKTYKDMKYDAWGRLVEVRNQSSVVQATYRYNGLGHRITWHDDADNDTDVDGNDPVYHLAYTEDWRMVAVYRGSDANVKEQIYLHLRGLSGWPSVKCDGETEVILVDADRSTTWSAAADTVTETRSYLLTNQRGDVVTVISDAGRIRERPRYSAYGVPMLIMRTDWDADGDVDSSTGAGTDQAAYEADYFAGSPPARADYNFDGNIDPDDLSDYIADRTADAGGGYGYGRLSSAGVGNRKGFRGWEHGRLTTDIIPDAASLLYLGDLGVIVDLCTDDNPAPPKPTGPWDPPAPIDRKLFTERYCPNGGCDSIPSHCLRGLRKEIKDSKADPWAVTGCCDGMEFSCVWCAKIRKEYTPLPKPRKKNEPPPAQTHPERGISIVIQCTMQHEEQHQKEFACPQSQSCKTGYCAPLGPHDGMNCAEYRGWGRGCDCLSLALTRKDCLGDPVCIEIVERDLKTCRENLDEYRRKCPDAPKERK